MQLDSLTILIGACVLLGLLALVFVGAWVRQRKNTWLLWFGLPLLAAAVGTLSFTRPGWDANTPAIMFGNGLRIIAIGAYWQGCRVFERRSLKLWPVVAALVLWLGLCLQPDFIAAKALRVALTSTLAAGFTTGAAFELWRGRSERLASRWPLIAVFASFAVGMALRAVFSPIVPFPMGGAPDDPSWFGVLVVFIFGHAMLAGLLMLGMAVERTLATQSSANLSDSVTGLLTRRAFVDFSRRTNRRRAGLRSSLAIVVVDLDGFREINQQVGRQGGDALLRALGDYLEAHARPADQVFRLGNDRFIVALPEASRQQAVALAEAIRSGLHTLASDAGVEGRDITLSIGIAETLHPVEVRVILLAAEHALQQAKQNGGNRIVIAEAASLFRAQIDDIAGPTRGTA